MAIVPFFAGWRALGRCYRCFPLPPAPYQVAPLPWLSPLPRPTSALGGLE